MRIINARRLRDCLPRANSTFGFRSYRLLINEPSTDSHDEIAGASDAKRLKMAESVSKNLRIPSNGGAQYAERHVVAIIGKKRNKATRGNGTSSANCSRDDFCRAAAPKTISRYGALRTRGSRPCVFARINYHYIHVRIPPSPPLSLRYYTVWIARGE